MAYVGQMLSLGGSSDPHAQAREIIAFETAAAKVQWPIEKRRDVDATYNPRTKAQLLAYRAGLSLGAFLDAQQLGDRQQLVLAELTAMRDLAKLYAHTPVPTLKAFLTFHYLSDNAAYLPKRFDEAHFAFYGQTMRGQPQQKERWKRAVNAIDGPSANRSAGCTSPSTSRRSPRRRCRRWSSNLLAASASASMRSTG